MDQAKLVKLGIALGACWGVMHFVKNPMAKTAATAIGAVIVARQLPFVGDALSA